MDIVLGVSMTPTTVRMVLVEGEKADGLTVDHDVFDVATAEDSATSGAADQVIAAILGTQQNALAGGHNLVTTGVAWRDRDEAADLREGLAACGIEDVILVFELHAAGALAQAVGRAMGYDTTALMFVTRDSVTLEVVKTGDGSIVKVVNRSFKDSDVDELTLMAEMAEGLEDHASRPEGLFIVGSGVDIAAAKERLEGVVSLPVSAPEDAEVALARGAALLAAATPRYEAVTAGLAYSLDPDGGPTAGNAYSAVDHAALTQFAAVTPDDAGVAEHEEEARKPFLLVGSALTAIFVVGVVALVISLAVSIRPTVDQRPAPGEKAVIPNIAAPPAPVIEDVPAAPPPAPAPPPVENIPAPVPVVQQAPVVAPRTVLADMPAPAAPPPAPAPAAPPPAPAPAAPPPAPAPAAPVPAPIPAPVPVVVPPNPVLIPPLVPIYRPPVVFPAQPPWGPPPQLPPRVPQSPPRTVPQAPPTVPQLPPTVPHSPPTAPVPPVRVPPVQVPPVQVPPVQVPPVQQVPVPTIPAPVRQVPTIPAPVQVPPVISAPIQVPQSPGRSGGSGSSGRGPSGPSLPSGPSGGGGRGGGGGFIPIWPFG